MLTIRGVIPAVLASLVCTHASAATRVATVVRGSGAGADKAAGFVSHFIGELLDADSGYEVIDLEQALAGPAASTEQAFVEAQQLVEKGRGAYETLDLDPAVEYLDAALAIYEKNAAYVTDVSQVASVLMLLGATHILRGEDQLGSKRLAQAIALHPTVEPDPRIFNPGMRQIFQEAADELARQPRGTVSITSNPSYAQVYLDGELVGVTPMAIDQVTEGRHYLRLVKPGYRNWGRVLDVVGRAEAADVATLREVDTFEELDAWLTVAMKVLPDKEVGDGAGDVIKQLGLSLGAEQLALVEVKLDGDRVDATAYRIDVQKGEVLATARQIFSYDTQPETYRREIGVLVASLITGVPGGVGGDGEGDTLATGLCIGMDCALVRELTLYVGGGVGGAVAILGGVFWGVAYGKFSQFQDLPQASQAAVDARASGEQLALLGDVFVPLGVAIAAAGVLTWYFWHPTSTTEEVLGESAGWGFTLLPLGDGAAFSATARF